MALHLTLLIALVSMSAAGRQTGAMSGRVTDAVSGAPIAGAMVYTSYTPAKSDIPARTDADGRYTLQGVPPGRYRLRAEHPNYVTRVYGQALDDFLTAMILADGQTIERIDFPLARAAFVKRHVTGEGGRPLEKAEVTVQSFGGRPLFVGATTNERGEFELRLASGRYLVEARVWALADQASPPDVVIKDGATSDRVEIVIARR